MGGAGAAAAARMGCVSVSGIGATGFRSRAEPEVAVQKIADGALLGRNDALDEREARARTTRDQNLPVEARSCGGNVGHLSQTIEQRTPVADAVSFDAHQLHVSGGAEQLFLEVAAHTVGNCQSDNQRGNSGCDACYGDGRDNADHGLPPLCSQVPCRQKEFESHCASSIISLQRGSKGTSNDPSGAKASSFCAIYGTAEAVPFQARLL